MSLLPRCICDPLEAMAGRYDELCARHAFARNYLAELARQREELPTAAEYRPVHGGYPTVPAGVKGMDPWRLAVDTALVDSGLDCTTDNDDPAARVRELVEWTRTVALDPAVSAEAQALIERGASGVDQPDGAKR